MSYYKIDEDQLDMILHMGAEREAVEVIQDAVGGVSLEYIARVLKDNGIEPVANRTRNWTHVIPAVDEDCLEEFEKELKEAHRIKYENKVRVCKATDQPFNVAFEDIEWVDFCPVLGIQLDYFPTRKRQDNSPEFDKVIPERGYVKGNVKIISARANRLKDNGTMDEHFQIAWYIQEHLKE